MAYTEPPAAPFREAAEDAEARAAAEAEAFDEAILRAKWRDVLDSYRLVLWLPAGSVPGSVTLTARQAVGLFRVGLGPLRPPAPSSGCRSAR